MPLDVDPYGALGLPRGASLDEVKRAYRRLAKANHPDAGGPAALPRFLAIQAAYEQIVGGSGGPAAVGRSPSTARRRPSAADPDRTDATRRAYGGRAQGSRTGTSPDGDGATGAAGGRPTGGARPDPARPRPSHGPAEPDGTGRSTPRSPNGATASGGGRRGKATLGSTSYDGADSGQFEPDWGGASWYGTTSGTYWTINPKEYADPRKHGPEYQARARRATHGEEAAAAGDGASSSVPRPPADAGHTTTSWWDSTSGPEAAATEPAAPADPAQGSEAPTPQPTGPYPSSLDPARAAARVGRALTDPDFGGLRERTLRAVVGWLPIAFGLGWLVGELTGCGRFAATCDPAVAPLTAIGQGTVLVAFLVLPEIAALAAAAALGLLAAAMAAGLALSATGGAADEASRQVALGAILIVAWLSGFAIVVVRRRSGRRPGPGAPRPVS